MMCSRSPLPTPYNSARWWFDTFGVAAAHCRRSFFFFCLSTLCCVCLFAGCRQLPQLAVLIRLRCGVRGTEVVHLSHQKQFLVLGSVRLTDCCRCCFICDSGGTFFPSFLLLRDSILDAVSELIMATWHSLCVCCCVCLCIVIICSRRSVLVLGSF